MNETLTHYPLNSTIKFNAAQQNITTGYVVFFKVLNQAADFLLLNFSMIVAYCCVETAHDKIIWFNNRRYLSIVLIFNLLWLLCTNITKLYEHVIHKDSVKTYISVCKAYGLFFTLICTVVLFLINNEAYLIKPLFLYYSLGIFLLLFCSWKFVFLLWRKSGRAQLIETKNIVIIGAGRISKDLAAYFSFDKNQGYQVHGVFDNKPEGIIDEEEIYLGNTDQCISYCIDHAIDEIYCALPYDESETVNRLMLEADKNLIRFKLIPDYHYIKRPVFVQSYGHIPVLSIRQEPLESMLNRVVKRLFDILFSLFVLIFLFSWLFPIIAVLILYESKGPVIFKQVRSGRHNQPFKCYKFRSMRVNCDCDKKQADKNDNRISKVGSFLRRTSLDELPQFFNVLLGNMTVVGPRPHMLSHTAEYAQLIDQFMIRHLLKPGITGWAQVNGLRGGIQTTDDILDRVKADVWYLENWSFLLDLKIIFLTLWNAVRGEENAY